MGKFDPIDIFFIAIISTYFITLICIGITFLCIAISKNKKNKSLNGSQNVIKEEVIVDKKPKKEKHKKEWDIKKLKDKLVAVPLFRKLFMKEVTVDREEKNTKVLETEKIKVEPNKQHTSR